MAIALASLIALELSAHLAMPMATAVGAANIVVTNVYWGLNPLSPSTARPGDINVQLSIVLTNVGDDVARGVNATLFLSPPLLYSYYLDGKEYSSASVSKVAGDILAGSSFTVAFMLAVGSNAREGIYRCKFGLSYRSARELQQVNVSTMIDVPLWKSDLRVQKVHTVPTKIFPGSKQVRLEILMINSGKGTANNLQLRLLLKPPFKSSSGGSDRFYLGDLPAQQTSDVEFMIDVAENAPFGQYSLVVMEEHGSSLTPVDQFPLYLEEKARFNLVAVSPTSMQVGAKGVVVRVELKNTGSVKTESVRVQLLVGNLFSGTLTDFLGTMLAGEEKVASFTIDIDSKAQERRYDFDLRIDWTQEDGVLDETLRLTLTLHSGEDAGLLFPIILLIVVAVAAYLMSKRLGIKIPLLWKRSAGQISAQG